MKKIGFLSFGHWTPSPQSGTRSAADALLQSIDLAVAAEELGADDYLVKSQVVIGDVVERIKHHLGVDTKA